MKTCISCIKNCETCDTFDSCEECRYGFSYDKWSHRCKGVPTIRQKGQTVYGFRENEVCSDGTYLLGNQCKDCPQNCQVCKNGTSCDKCADGSLFHADSKSCSCPTGQFMNNNKCNPCFSNCLDCTKETCKKCKENFLLEAGSCNRIICGPH